MGYKKIKIESSELLNQGDYAVILRARIYRENQKCPQNSYDVDPNANDELKLSKAIIKKLPQQWHNTRNFATLKHEYQTIRELHHEHIIALHPLMSDETLNQEQQILFEDQDSTSIKSYKAQFKENLKLCLTLFQAMTKALNYLHKKGIVHKDISSHNIIFNSSLENFKLIDFGCSSNINIEKQRNSSFMFEGTPTYVSPEQTGRTNLPIDDRSDLYSLAVVIYEMLVGHAPFEFDNPLSQIHAHIAMTPESPCEQSRYIPKQVSDIIMKCLEKEPDNRYQSSHVLLHDINTCLDALENNGNIEAFPLASAQKDDKIKFSSKLYGRELDLKQLLLSFKQVRSGQSKMVLVAGYSGMGKTSLVKNLLKPLSETKGVFLSGKFDQFQTTSPYFGLIQALSQFLSEIFEQNKEVRNYWKRSIVQKLAGMGSILFDVLPSLKQLIGEQPKLEALPDEESRNRFSQVFRNLLHALSSKEHPLLLFLDDLQWADSSSLDILKYIIMDQDFKYTLVIGSYRSNEVSDSHILNINLKQLESSGAQIDTIVLSGLSEHSIREMLQDCFSKTKQDYKELAQFLYKKTDGNPFFTIELIKRMHEQKIIRFDDSHSIWCWDLSSSSANTLSDNVIELMTEKIAKLPDQTREYLKLSACMGSKFSFKNIVDLSGDNASIVFQSLEQAFEQGEIIPIDDHYRLANSSDRSIENFRIRFAHDKVQQAVYALMDASERCEKHASIARYFLAQHKNATKPVSFEIANHCASAVSLIKKDKNSEEFAKNCLQAGLKAKDTAAYQSAKHYLETARDLLADNHWQQSYRLSLDTFSNLATVTYLCSDFSSANDLYTYVLNYAKSAEDRYEIYLTQIMQFTAQGYYGEAVQTASKALKLCDVAFPSNPTLLDLAPNLIQVKQMLFNINWNQLSSKPNCSDKKALNAMKILSNVSTAAYIHKPESIMLVCMKAIKLSLTYGHAPVSGFAYALMAFLEAVKFKNIRTARKLLTLAKELNQKYDDINYRAKILYVEGAFVQHFYHPIEQSFNILRSSYESGVKGGDLNYANYALWTIIGHRNFIGGSLLDLAEETDRYSEFSLKIGDKFSIPLMQVCRRFFSLLNGKASKKYQSIDKNFTEDQFITDQKKADYDMALAWYYTLEGIKDYILGERSRALKSFDRCYPIAEKTIMGQMLLFDFYFFYCLIIAANIQSMSTTHHLKYRIRFKLMLQKLAFLSKLQENNFRDRYYLAKAEYQRCFDSESNWLQSYLNAIKIAKNNKHLQIQAIACENLALYLNHTDHPLWTKMIIESYHLYEIWECNEKCQLLKRRYPEIIFQRDNLPNSSATMITTVDNLDLHTILDLSKKISENLKYVDLISIMIKSLVENAGAQIGHLLLTNDKKELQVAASWNLSDRQVTLSQNQDFRSNNDIFHPIIDQIMQTFETVVVHNMANHQNYGTNLKVLNYKMKSLLGIPLVKQSKLVGIMYFENRGMIGAFTKERIELLKVLSSQMAIYIEHALIYEQLEERIQNRTAQLAEKNNELTEAVNENQSLVRILCHDLANTTNVFLISSQLMNQTSIPISEDKAKELWKNIQTTAELQRSITDNVRRMSALHDGKLNLEIIPVALDDIFRKCEILFDDRIKKKNLILKINWTNIAGIKVMGEVSTLVNSIFANIISNAIKFTDAHGVIDISAYEQPNNIDIVIKDSGVGMPESLMKNIFDAGVVTTRKGTNGEAGTGYGMPLVKTCVEKMGGQIKVSSQTIEQQTKEHGTTFTISLKRAG